MTLEIKGFLETSLVDWDGHIASVIFLPGCNFRCPYCHNTGLILHPEKYRTIPEEKIFEYLASHRSFIDGVCITGGEPVLHKDAGLTDLIKKIKKDGFKVKLDTNGTDPKYIKELIDAKLIDFVAMDVKAPLEKYHKATNVKGDPNAIRESVHLLITSGIDHEFRTTAVPTLIDLHDIEEMAKMLSGAKKYVLQQFEPDNCEDIELKKIKPYGAEMISKMLEAAKKHVPNSMYRGK